MLNAAVPSFYDSIQVTRVVSIKRALTIGITALPAASTFVFSGQMWATDRYLTHTYVNCDCVINCGKSVDAADIFIICLYCQDTYASPCICHMEVGAVEICRLMSVLEGKGSIVFGTKVVGKPHVVYPYYAA
jgi:hypothetical protein